MRQTHQIYRLPCEALFLYDPVQLFGQLPFPGVGLGGIHLDLTGIGYDKYPAFPGALGKLLHRNGKTLCL